MLAARQRVIRRIRRFALATGRRTQDVAVTTSIEGSLHAKQRTTVYESTTWLQPRNVQAAGDTARWLRLATRDASIVERISNLSYEENSAINVRHVSVR